MACGEGEVTERYVAQEAFEATTIQNICFNAFDPPQEWMRGVADWERWCEHFKTNTTTRNGETKA